MRIFSLIALLGFGLPFTYTGSALAETLSFNVELAKESVAGVGLGLKLVDGKLLIEAIVENSPAYIDGQLQIGDEILSVKPTRVSAWHSLKGLSMEQAVDLIRGPEGTTVGLVSTSFPGSVNTPVFLVRAPLEDL